MLSALGSSLREHPAGPLRPRLISQFTPATSEFEFLGYVFRRNCGEVSVAPTWKHLARFDYRFVEGLDRATRVEVPNTQKKRELKALLRYVRSWTAAFSLWSEAKSFRENKMALIKYFLDRLDESEAA